MSDLKGPLNATQINQCFESLHEKLSGEITIDAETLSAQGEELPECKLMIDALVPLRPMLARVVNDGTFWPDTKVSPSDLAAQKPRKMIDRLVAATGTLAAQHNTGLSRSQISRAIKEDPQALATLEESLRTQMKEVFDTPPGQGYHYYRSRQEVVGLRNTFRGRVAELGRAIDKLPNGSDLRSEFDARIKEAAGIEIPWATKGTSPYHFGSKEKSEPLLENWRGFLLSE